MSQRIAVLTLTVVLLLFGALMAACGDDGDGTPDSSATTDATEPAGDGDGDATETPGDGDGGSSASATLTVGGESWTFDGIRCAFTPEESGIDVHSFRLSGTGETDDGLPIRLQATMHDVQAEGRYEGDGVIHIVEMTEVDDTADPNEPAFGWISSIEIFEDVEPVIVVEDKEVTAETTFDDDLTANQFEDVPGTLAATCP